MFVSESLVGKWTKEMLFPFQVAGGHDTQIFLFFIICVLARILRKYKGIISSYILLSFEYRDFILL